MTRLLMLLDAVCKATAFLGALALAGLFLLGITEIMLRNIISVSLSFASEYMGYGVALVLMLSLGEAVRSLDHVRVGLLSERLSGEARVMLDAGAALLGLCIALFLTIAMLRYAVATGEAGTLSYFASQTPLVIPQMLLALGPVSLSAGLLARFIRIIDPDTDEDQRV